MGGAPSLLKRKGDASHASQFPSPVHMHQCTTIDSALASPLLKRPYHMFDEIVKLSTAGPKPEQKDACSRSGIFLDTKTMKYWVDGKNNNCFMIYPRGLFITWGADTRYSPRYWSYRKETNKERIVESPVQILHCGCASAGRSSVKLCGSDPNLEVAELLSVCWLEIHGKLELSYLNPGVTYEAFFEIWLNENASGWGTPVDLQLKLPQERVQGRKQNLNKKPTNKWLLLKVGDICQPESGQNGEVVISLFQYGYHWKQGLIIKGIVITPLTDHDSTDLIFDSKDSDFNMSPSKDPDFNLSTSKDPDFNPSADDYRADHGLSSGSEFDSDFEDDEQED